MFRDVQATKHCNAQKINFSLLQSSRNTVMLKKFQNVKESAPGLAVDARVLEFFEFLSITAFREF